jgi:hypothetical protein
MMNQYLGKTMRREQHEVDVDIDLISNPDALWPINLMHTLWKNSLCDTEMVEGGELVSKGRSMSWQIDLHGQVEKSETVHSDSAALQPGSIGSEQGIQHLNGHDSHFARLEMSHGA